MHPLPKQGRRPRSRGAVGVGDLAGELEFLPRRTATESVYRGLAGVERFIADTREVFDKFEMRYEYADLGEWVLVWAPSTSARRAAVSIVRWEDFGSKDKALEAVGLSKQDAHADS